MNRLIILLIYLVGGAQASASNCVLPPIELFNNTGEEVVVGFNLRFEKFDAADHRDETLNEFISKNPQIEKLEPWSYKQFKLSYGCGYGPAPVEFWFSHKVWGTARQNVMEYSESARIIVE